MKKSLSLFGDKVTDRDNNIPTATTIFPNKVMILRKRTGRQSSVPNDGRSDFGAEFGLLRTCTLLESGHFTTGW